MFSLRRANELPGRGLAARVKRDRDDREVAVLELTVKSLPPGQVKRASSPRCPREEKNLLAAMVGEPMQVANDIGQFEVGRDARAQ